MQLITLPAHFDGEKICLDVPYELKRNYELFVVVMPRDEDEVKTEHLKGVPGKQLLKHMGVISSHDAKMMTKAIEEGCERIDSDEW